MTELDAILAEVERADAALLRAAAERRASARRLREAARDLVPEERLALQRRLEDSLRRAADGAELSLECVRELTAEKASEPRSETFSVPGLDPRPVVLIGGRGGMGRTLARHFERSGSVVRILEKDDWPRAHEILSGAGVVMVGVPIDATEAVVRMAAPHLEPDALLCDIASVKTGPVRAMLEAHSGPVAGFHPMFGPDVVDYARQVFVYVPGRSPEAAEPLLRLIRAWGARVVRTTAEEHDRSMGIIQALRHFTTYAYGLFLARVRPDLGKLLELSSPIYRLELLMVGRLFAQDPHLYADIIMASKEKGELIRAYVESLAPEVERVLARDRDGFVERFLEARAYFGDWAPEFMRESGELLARIQAARR